MPAEQKNLYIGLMSGTSLDGLDLAALRIQDDQCEFLCAQDFCLPASLREKILQLTQPGNNEIERLGQLDRELGMFFGEKAQQFIKSQDIPQQEIAAIGSHGQTIRHHPEMGFTLQIGDPNQIAELSQCNVVADFRRRDLAAGGQGAPLVPAFHKALFQSNTIDRIILNIGGMANLTFLPKDSSQSTIGFDTGPGNVLLDAWIQDQNSQAYDKDGAWASTGKVNIELLNRLYALDFFSASPPKSTGREQFNLAWIKDSATTVLPAEDIQATLLELTAISIVDAIANNLPTKFFELYLCGGGAHNKALVTRLRKLLPNISVTTSEVLGIHPDWVEAAAFAWMAQRTLQGLSSNLPEATGATGERILGALYQR